ncbi:uncharacterized protein LOC133287308 [Gastrolobium bilobum]|uniref:uncharacterized protein LOC133287308 n=1 Tax=Gastrolobium bilobum TaxID=150636 RepID=UPI002AAF24B9|nr:uncharacterized protein LOC133287308 [Gastrolobium bilobum]
MDSSNVRKSNIRKGKVEIKKVEEKSKNCATFSKCKQVWLWLPDPDSVIRRYHGGAEGGEEGYHNRAAKRRFQEGVETLKLKYEATEAKLKEENMHHEDTTEGKKNGLVFTEWWDLSLEDMGFEQVEEFKNCLEDLKIKLVAAREKKKKKEVDNSLPPLPVALQPLPVASSPMQSLSDVSFLNEGFNGYGVWNCVIFQT